MQRAGDYVGDVVDQLAVVESEMAIVGPNPAAIAVIVCARIVSVGDGQ